MFIIAANDVSFFTTVLHYGKIIFYALIGLGVLVFIHELGHLVMAKISKIGVERFSIGWGKAMVQKKIGSTTYQIGWLLVIGGYCKMKGQDDFTREDPEITPDSFFGRPPWARLLAVLGGPLFSYLFAALLFFIIFFSAGISDIKYTRIAVNPKDAKSYELKTGDIITHINGRKVNTWMELKESLVENTDNKISIIIKRGILKVNGIKINSYANTFKAIELLNKESNISISEVYTSKTITHNQKMARLAKKIKDISIYTSVHPVIGGISKGETMPAKDKFFKGDIILRVNNKPVYQFEELVYFINDFKQKNPESVPVFTIYRYGKKNLSKKEITTSVKQNWTEISSYFIKNKNNTFSFKQGTKEDNLPLGLRVLFRKSLSGRLNIPVDPIKMGTRYVIGIQIIPRAPEAAKKGFHKSLGFFTSFGKGFSQTNKAIILNVKGIIRLIRGDIPVKGNLGGPIKIFSMLGKMGATHGLLTFLNFVAMISALLAFANMLPIPAVDGSHVILSLIEMIRRKNFSPTFIRRFQTVGLFTLIALLLIVTYLDIFSLF